MDIGLGGCSTRRVHDRGGVVGVERDEGLGSLLQVRLLINSTDVGVDESLSSRRTERIVAVAANLHGLSDESSGSG